MKTVLADGNMLIALTVSDHVHHKLAIEWFENYKGSVATTPITQGTLIRFLIREGFSAADSIQILATLTKNSWHKFWEDNLPYTDEVLRGVIGHRQVTDAYLVALANHNNGLVATLDQGLALLHKTSTILIKGD